MQSGADSFIPILFKVLFAFIIINMIVNLCLLYSKKFRIYKLMAVYWPILLVVFAAQGMFQTHHLHIALAYSTSCLSGTIFAMIGFEVLGRSFPLRNYILYYLSMYPVTYAIYNAGYGFTAIAMPFAVATATPLLHTAYYILIKNFSTTTRLQKLLGGIYVIMTIHCINFAVFRMDPGAQLWGWLVAYAIYDTLAILLPSIALEEASMSENERLQNLVEKRTSELNKSLKENEGLLRVVLHDLSSPLMTMRFYLAYVRATPETDEFIEKARKSQSAMEKIIFEIKNIYGLKNKKVKAHLRPVGLEECFNDVSFIFAQKLEKKNINLIFNNQLSPNTKVLADQTTLTHSVLSNLVSNGLKFSYPNSQIEVTAKEHTKGVILEVKDQGPGIPDNVIKSILLDQDLESSEGTFGEFGSGFGLSIVKSFVDSYGGQIEFDSRTQHTHPQNHGTSIKIILDRA
jgi:signal transduction histidine kinase